MDSHVLVETAISFIRHGYPINFFFLIKKTFKKKKNPEDIAFLLQTGVLSHSYICKSWFSWLQVIIGFESKMGLWLQLWFCPRIGASSSSPVTIDVICSRYSRLIYYFAQPGYCDFPFLSPWISDCLVAYSNKKKRLVTIIEDID